VHEAGEAEEPSRWGEVFTADDALSHEELCTVDDQSGEMTDKEHYNNTDEDASKIHLVMSRTVPVRPHMGVLNPSENPGVEVD